MRAALLLAACAALAHAAGLRQQPSDPKPDNQCCPGSCKSAICGCSAESAAVEEAPVIAKPLTGPLDECCNPKCSLKVCVLPWVAVCLQCPSKDMEKVHVETSDTHAVAAPKPTADDFVASPPTSGPNPFTSCCSPKCSLKVCIRPIVAVCAGCSDPADELVQVDHAAQAQAVATAPYKHCCDPKCKSQICVPPFVSICNGCPGEMSQSVLA